MTSICAKRPAGADVKQTFWIAPMSVYRSRFHTAPSPLSKPQSECRLARVFVGPAGILAGIGDAEGRARSDRVIDAEFGDEGVGCNRRAGESERASAGLKREAR